MSGAGTDGRRRVVLIAGGGTGGHLMPALAIAERLRAEAPDLEPVLVGARRGIEARILPSRNFRHYLLPAEPIYRRTWWKNLRWPFVAGRLMTGVVRLPNVPMSKGVRSVSPITSVMDEAGAWSSSATAWVSEVRISCPTSTLPV